jgi:membrane-bound metal-dependent hydrolase YbcI (DUF457 family)
MDFATHAAVGALVGRAIAGRASGAVARRAMAVGAVTALVPDVDHVLELISGEAYLVWHRTVTHSLVFAAGMIAAAALAPASSEISRARRAVVVAASMASHLFLDVLTPFGTGLLWPFDDRMFALDGLPIMAPITVILAIAGVGTAVLAERRHHPWTQWIAIGALLLYALFWSWETGMSRVAAGRIKELGHAPVLSVPHPGNPTVADVFTVDTDAATYFQVHVVGGEGRAQEMLRRPLVLGIDGATVPAEDAATVDTIARKPSVARVLRRFRVPVARVEARHRVVWTDLQFQPIFGEDTTPFRIVWLGGQDVEVEQRPRGPQLALWTLSLVAVLWIVKMAGVAPWQRR